MLNVPEQVREARENAQRQVDWISDRQVLNSQTGEVIALADVSRSWYVREGARRNVRICSRRAAKALHHPADELRHRPKLITLTFADAMESWEKEGALSQFCNSLQHWAKRHGAQEPAYFWVDEVQMKTERGAAHYHVFVVGMPYVQKKILEGWWRFGFLDIRAFDTIGRGLSYLKKYLWKWAEVDVDIASMPDWWFYYSIFAKRRFGFSRWFSFSPGERIPSWLREVVTGMGLASNVIGASRMEGGGWLLKCRGSPLSDDVMELRMKSPFCVRFAEAERSEAEANSAASAASEHPH